MQPNNGQPGSKSANGAASHGPTATPKSRSAAAVGDVAATGAASPRSQSPPAPPPSAAPTPRPAPKVSLPVNTAGKRPVATATTEAQAQSTPEPRADKTATPPRKSPRPLCFSDDVDIDKLPRGVQAGINHIVAPCYEQLVMGESDAMARAFGEVFTAETAQGIVSKPQLLDRMMSSTADPQELEQSLSRHDRHVRRLVLIGNALTRYRSSKAKKGLLG